MAARYLALGPLRSGEGSRAFLGLCVTGEEATPCVLVWAPEHLVAAPELVDRLRAETLHASLLLHRNVARVLGLVEVDEGLARAVEFVDGESLRRVIQVAGRLPAGLAARVAVDAAAGVQYAHLSGNEDGTPLVHGDLRPETVLVSYAGVTKVTGYGALSVAPRETGGQRVLGRRQHCAPEQLLGGRHAATVRTDVYLLGVLLYEALTGQVPFADEEDFDAAVLAREPSQLGSPLIPDALREVIARAMSKKATLRYAGAGEFREAVEAAAGALPAPEEVGDFLAVVLASDEARDDRRRVVEAGLREWRQRQVEAALPGVELAPAAPPAPARPPAPAPAPRVERFPPPARKAEPPPARRPRPLLAALGPLLAVAAALAVTAWWMHRPRPTPGPAAPPPVAGGPAARPAPPAPLPPAMSQEEVRVPPAPRPAPARSAAPAAPAAAAPATLDIATEPPLAVAVDGKAVGRSPLTLEVAPGPHKVALTDRVRRIERVQTVRARPGRNELRWKVGHGTLAVDAPPGCEVSLDGEVVGQTPLAGPLTVYEGSHRLQVRQGEARWQQPFTLRDGDELTADVHFETRPAP